MTIGGCEAGKGPIRAVAFFWPPATAGGLQEHSGLEMSPCSGQLALTAAPWCLAMGVVWSGRGTPLKNSNNQIIPLTCRNEISQSCSQTVDCYPYALMKYAKADVAA
ncbi:hypothetical protein SAV31267_097510 [Streptomyces avermitilis]|uniref:Uncharacterized protein n=1 Tax=Streptomyces avermitilis TaxID=33903 RepID=A0A4D4N8Y2_STRAX|nr:hypothetical protein SAV31267_097510 [Streptomyces avermitilis]